MIVDGTKAGAPGSCSADPVDQNLGPLGSRGSSGGTQRDRRVEGGRRERRQPHGVQLPRGCGRFGQRDLVERRRRTAARSGCTGTRASYLTATSTYFGTPSNTKARRDDRRPVRDLRLQHRRAGQLEPALCEQLQRLGDVRRRVPAGLRRDHRPRLDGVQRARLLGDQLRRVDRHRELRSSTTTRTGSTPTPRSTAIRPRRRTAPARTTGSARSPTPTRAGSSSTTIRTTTTIRTSPRRAMPATGRPGPA